VKVLTDRKQIMYRQWKPSDDKSSHDPFGSALLKIKVRGMSNNAWYKTKILHPRKPLEVVVRYENLRLDKSGNMTLTSIFSE
jgi:hypothetical protein